MGKNDSSGTDKRKQVEEGQGSGSAQKEAKATREAVEAPTLKFWPGQLNEKHTWLEFSRVKQPHKNNFLNELFSIHKEVVCPPRYLAPAAAQHFGIQADINGWFRIEAQVGDRLVVSDMWHNVFNNRELVYRELCLEFYSTLKVTKELNKVKNIFEERCVTFHCGGVARKISISQFGYYTGMYTLDQLKSSEFRSLLRQGLYVKQTFDGESIPQYWTRITGGEAWPFGGSDSVSKIRSVRLRMLHRMIVTFLVQRSTHWYKAYKTDLWLMKLFAEGRRFALALIVVLDRMWNHSDSELVLGHFVTMIYRCMGIFDTDECHTDLSPPIFQETLTEAELVRAKIVKKMTQTENSRLLDDIGFIAPPPVVEGAEDVEMRDAPQEQPRRRAPTGIDLTPLSTQLQQIYEGQQASRQAFDDYQRRVDHEVTWLGLQQAHTNYTLDYYQPMWQAQYTGTKFVRPDPIPPFSPPPIRVPPYRQDGGSYFFTPSQMSPRPHDLGGSPRGPVQFGRYTGGDAGISSSMPSFFAGANSGFVDFAGGSGGFAAGGSGQGDDQPGGGYGGSGSGGTPEQATSWVDDLFGPPGALYGYHGQQQ